MTTILVDGNNLGIAAQFASDPLTDPLGRPVGAIYGFLRSLRPILVRVQDENPGPVKLLVAWDAGESWRLRLFGSYKESRKEEKDQETEQKLREYADQVPRLRNILPLIGVGQIRAEGYEADDIAGWLTAKFKDTRYVLVTNDKDWLQLVSDRVFVWQPLKERLVTLANFGEATKDIIRDSKGTCCPDTDTLVRMLAIAGDSGDDVPGIAGVGYSTAMKYLTGALTKGKRFEAIKAWEENPDGYARSLRLVDLRDIQVDFRLLHLAEGQFDKSAFMHTCIEYGFNSILKDFSGWVLPFERMG